MCYFTLPFDDGNALSVCIRPACLRSFVVPVSVHAVRCLIEIESTAYYIVLCCLSLPLTSIQSEHPSLAQT